MPEDKAPALKEIFNKVRIEHVAKELAIVYPKCDLAKFKKSCLKNLDQLSLMERLHRVAEALKEVLPAQFAKVCELLCALAPRLNSGFVTMALADCVTLYPEGDFDLAATTLKTLTAHGSSEFAIRHLLARDLKRMIKIMEHWSSDKNEHVRRLASEGSRPRLPWAQKIPALLQVPPPTAKILKNLLADSSLYVRKSVANHLNDITKSDPDWVLDLIESCSLETAETMWIAKHALRGLIKKGNKRALAVIGATGEAEVTLAELHISPKTIQLGSAFKLSFKLASTSAKPQKLVIDYAIHYVKKSGAKAPKVFKLKTFDLQPHETVSMSRSQMIDDFTTRVHYAGKHEIDILANGVCIGKTAFVLKK